MAIPYDLIDRLMRAHEATVKAAQAAAYAAGKGGAVTTKHARFEAAQARFDKAITAVSNYSH